MILATLANVWSHHSHWVIATLVCLLARRLFSRRTRARPPGPRSLPLIGNIWRLNPKEAWLEFTRLREVYGDLVYYHGLGNGVLVLNSTEAIRDLLEKRSRIYSDRPVFTVAGKMMGLDKSMPLLCYGAEWRAIRKMAHFALSSTAVAKYHHIQEGLAVLLLRDILDSPEDFDSHIRLTSGRIVLTITYGLDVRNADDNYITDAEETMKIVGEAIVPGAFIADFVPFLQHLKFLPFQKDAEFGRQIVDRLVTRPLVHVKKQMASGNPPDSLTRDLLEQDFTSEEERDRRVTWTSGSLYGAGVETTYTVVAIFILAMVMHPDVQKKARAEIESFLPSTRLLKIEDRNHLPYIGAVIKECLRWHPPLPLSLARATTEDDVYNGYFLPRGTVVMPNVWAIAFTPNFKYDPQKFIPERFLDKSQDVIDPMTYAFGFGKRICPGRPFAENSLFAIIANLLMTFDILPPKGGLKTPKFAKNLVSFPEPFECQFVPHEGMDNIVRSAAAELSI